MNHPVYTFSDIYQGSSSFYYQYCIAINTTCILRFLIRLDLLLAWLVCLCAVCSYSHVWTFDASTCIILDSSIKVQMGWNKLETYMKVVG